MKAIFIILILLIAAGVKKKDACKTRRHYSHHVKDPEKDETAPLASEPNAAPIAGYNVPNEWIGHPAENYQEDSRFEDLMSTSESPADDIGGTDITDDQEVSESEHHMMIEDEMSAPESAADEQEVRKDKKNLCQDVKRHKRAPLHVHREHTTHLLVVGAGAQLVAFLAALLELTNPTTCVRIIIVEKKPKFAVGLPFDNGVVIPEHLMYGNVHIIAALSVTHDDDNNATDYDKENGFAHWVSQYPSLFKIDRKIAQYELPPRRYVYGQYLQWTFQKLLSELDGMFDIVLIDGTSADNVTVGDSNFVVALSDGSIVHTIDIFLATGHWSSHLFDGHVTGFFQSPWPASALTHRVKGIPAHAKVGILGTGPNAVDATMTLAHGHGNFSNKEGGGFTFRPDSPHFHITMYSPKGNLPIVSGKIGRRVCKALEALAKADGAKPSLDDVLKAMRADLAAADSDVEIVYENAKQFILDLDYFLYEKHFPNDRLKFDSNGARESWQKWPLLSQSFFMAVQDYFIKFFPHFSPRDKITFRDVVAPCILNFIKPLPLEYAQKLLAMIEAQCLHAKHRKLW